MPEGDTIRKLAERINQRFAGERVERCVTRDPRLVGVDLTGTTLVAADAVGKHLLIRFDDGRTLHAHLRMDGSFVVGPRSARPEWQRRIELWLTSGRLTGVDVPVLGIVRTADEAAVVGHLGPDLCGPEAPDLDEVVARLTDDGAAPLGGALLDQRNVAGFGNVYAVELPFLVGVSPNQPVGTITGLRDLVAVGTALIRTNTARGPRNTTGRRLGDERPLDLRSPGPHPRSSLPRVRHRARRLGRRREPVAPQLGVVPVVPGRDARSEPSTSTAPAASSPSTRPAAIPATHEPPGTCDEETARSGRLVIAERDRRRCGRRAARSGASAGPPRAATGRG